MPLKLGYGAVGGATQPIRMLFHVLGQEYENVTYQDPVKWGETKQQMTDDGFPFPRLPYLQDGENYITESEAIPFYLCQKFNKDLFGKNALDTARVLQINGVIMDLHMAVMVPALTPGNQKEGVEKALQEGKKALEMIGKLATFLGDKQFLLGYMTYVDLKLAYNIHFYRSAILSLGVEDPFAKHPTLLKFAKGIYEHDDVKGFFGSKNEYPLLNEKWTPWFKAHPLP